MEIIILNETMGSIPTITIELVQTQPGAVENVPFDSTVVSNEE